MGPASGVCPDYSTSRGAFGYTLELRPGRGVDAKSGFAPPANLILPTAEECWAGIASAVSWTKDAPPPSTAAPAPPPPVSTCPLAFSTGPDSNGDCKCRNYLYCYENGRRGCTSSNTIKYGFVATRDFLPSCSGC